MQPEEFRQLGHWTLALAYYARHDVQSLMDGNGDRLILGFVAPLFAALRSQGQATDYSWMRYAEGGFHLRCQIRAATAEAGRCQLEEVHRQFDRFRLDSPEVFIGPQTLSPMAERLNRMSGIEARYDPGTLRAGPAYETGEETVYDRMESFQYVTRLQTMLSDICLAGLGGQSGYAARLELAHWCAYQILRLHASSEAQAATFAIFIQATWRQFFGISGGEDDPQATATWSRKEALSDRLRSVSEGAAHSADFTAGESSAAMLRRCEEAIATMREGRTILADEPPSLRAMQILALVHQVFNRLGIAISDESAFCRLVADQLCESPDTPRAAVAADVEAWMEHWRRNHLHG